jgi:diguanylate cyclase (GGDEF)-like protein
MRMNSLKSKLKKIFPAPEINHEDSARVTSILNYLLLIGLVMTTLFGLGGVIISEQPITAGAYALGFILAQLLAFWLLRTGRVRLASIVAIAGVMIILAYGTAVSGGLNSIGLSAQFILVILAGLLLGGRQAIVTAILWVVIDFALLVFELMGLPLVIQYIESPLSRMLSQTIDLLVVAILLFVTTHGLKDALSRARENERHLLHMASHDVLTKLPNRALLNDRLEHAMRKARRNHQRVAILFLDLDNFKTVNDAFGHQYGDQLLKLTSERLQGCIRSSDTFARVGGDEFVFLLEDISPPGYGAQVAENVFRALAVPFNFRGTDIYITTSIGISIFPENGEDAETLLQHADVAMHRAKAQGKSNYQYFSENMAVSALERVSLASRLRTVVDDGELEIYYQPQFNVGIGRVIAVEALLRWKHPEHGVISPTKFIPLAEETGLIVSIGEWVLRKACEQNMAWLKKGYPPIRMAVNLSERQLHQADFVDTIEAILKETLLPPHLLELELTESIVFQNLNSTLTLLQDLKDLGVNLSVDDFGSGFSTLSQLARFPFDTLKIDRYFAENVPHSAKVAAVVSGIIQIARNLGMSVVAEGVETAEQLSFYEAHGCNIIQGWYFSKALPGRTLEDRILKTGSLPMGRDFTA